MAENGEISDEREDLDMNLVPFSFCPVRYVNDCRQ